MLARPISVVLVALSLSTLSMAKGVKQDKSQPKYTTIALAPFSTGATEEYWFIGYALADVMQQRIARAKDVNTLSLKQWNAVLRDRDLPIGSIQSDAEIVRSGKLLGARYVVSGSYQAKWPDITVMLRVFDTQTGALAHSSTTKGHLERLLEIEGQLSKDLFAMLGKKLPPAPVRHRSVYAFRAAMICQETAMLQSLGPRSTPTLPAGAIWKAKGFCDQALAEDKTDAIALGAQGVLRGAAGDFAGAEKQLKMAVGYERQTGFADLGLFWVRVRQGKGELAVKELAVAVAKSPGDLHARGVLGQALNELGHHDAAKKVWEEYLRRSPGHPFALIQLGYTQARLGDIDAAIASVNQAISAVPDDAALYVERASREIDGKRYPAAEASLRKALQLDPNMALAYLRLGFVYMQTGQDNLAAPILDKALKAADMESEQRIRGVALFDLAKIEVRAGHKDQALSYLDQAVNEGFAKRRWLEIDADLAALKQDPRYIALLQRLQTAQVKPAADMKGLEW